MVANCNKIIWYWTFENLVWSKSLPVTGINIFTVDVRSQMMKSSRFEFNAIAWGTDDQRFYSRWAIARTLRALGSVEEARRMQDALLAERPTDEDVLAELRILAAL